MFEAAILPAVVSKEGTLRPLDWGELVGRFAAARDLRGILRPSAEGAGSFISAAASMHVANGERGVNLDALGRGKRTAAIIDLAAGEADMGDQGTR
jgi:hypothetical protein